MDHDLKNRWCNQKQFFMVLMLLICGWKLTSGIEHIMDIGLYDESMYLIKGVILADHGFPSADWGPLYSGWYFLLSKIQPSKIDLYYLNYRIISLLCPVFLFLLLRKIKIDSILSSLISFVFLISYANVPVWPKVSHFALWIVILSLIPIVWTQSTKTRLAIGCLSALICSYVRPEFFISFSIILVGYIFITIGGIKKTKAIDIAMFIGLVLISTFLLAYFGPPVKNSDRTLSAFSQHFSYNWVHWHQSHLNPWTENDIIMKNNFGTANSIFAVMASNPPVFFKHIGQNLINVPLTAIRLFFCPLRSLSDVSSPTLFFSLNVGYWLEALALILAAILFVKARQYRRITPFKTAFKTNKDILFIIFGFLSPFLLTILLIYPRCHYMIIAGTLFLIAILILFNPGLDSGGKTSFIPILILGLIMYFLTPLSVVKSDARQEVVNTIKTIQSLKIKARTSILEAEGGYNYYLSDNFSRIPEYFKTTGFNTFLKQQKFNMVVVSDLLKNDNRFKNDPQWLDFLANYEDYGFAAIKIPGSDHYLLVKKILLNHG